MIQIKEATAQHLVRLFEELQNNALFSGCSPETYKRRMLSRFAAFDISGALKELREALLEPAPDIEIAVTLEDAPEAVEIDDAVLEQGITEAVTKAIKPVLPVADADAGAPPKKGKKSNGSAAE